MSGFDLAHALQVASRVAWPSTAGWLTGLLHDAIEDGGVTADDLHEAFVPPDVVTAVEVLTRRQDETYADYIGRVAENPLARAVKLADIVVLLEKVSEPETTSSPASLTSSKSSHLGRRQPRGTNDEEGEMMTEARARVILAAFALFDEAARKARDANNPTEGVPTGDKRAVQAAEELALAWLALDVAIRPNVEEPA